MAPLQAFEVGEHQFGFDGICIGGRIDAAFDVGDVIVFEAAENVGDSVDFADVGEELVAKAFAFRGAAHEACDVDEGQAGRDDLG